MNAPRLCIIEHCNEPIKARGWCRKHYVQWHRTGDPVSAPAQRELICGAEGCDLPALCKNYCQSHYNRWRYSGDPIKRQLPDRCLTCGVEVMRRSGESRYCRKCRDERARTTARASSRRTRARYYEDPAVRRQRRSEPCVVCAGVVAQTSGHGPLRRFCSDECWEAYFAEWHRSWRERNRDKLQAAQHRRRARRQNAEYESFKPSDVFTRDAWHCYLCNEAIDSDLDYPHPRRVVLEHVVPLERGGSHTMRNTKAAHSVCNNIKATKLLSEMTWQPDRHCYI